MIAKYNRWSFMFGIPGIALQIAGRFIVDSQQPGPRLLGGLSMMCGTVLLVIGLSYYAKAKGRSSAWCLMGLLSIIGLLVLALLKDRSGVACDDGGEHAQA
jgi:hypothetical protein